MEEHNESMAINRISLTGMPVLPMAQRGYSNVLTHDHQQGHTPNLSRKEVLMSSTGFYEFTRELKSAIFGEVYHGVALQRVVYNPASIASSTHHDNGNYQSSQLQHPHPNGSTSIPPQEIHYLKRIKPYIHVAIKVYTKENLIKLREQTIENPIRELAAMQYIVAHGGHPNVVQMIECCQDQNNIYCIMEFCRNGELYEFVNSDGYHNYEECARYLFHQIVESVRYLHTLPAAHRDISLENVLITDDYRCKLVDFGAILPLQYDDPSGLFVPAVKSAIRCGKDPYMAPEVYASSSTSYRPIAADVWSLGILLYILLSKRFLIVFPSRLDPHYNQVHSHSLNNSLGTLFQAMGNRFSNEAVDLLSRMLRIDPNERISLDHVLQHPWMQLEVINPFTIEEE